MKFVDVISMASKKLLKEKPVISGIDITVPVMPHGSPRMEINSQNSYSYDYENCKLISFNKTGKTKIFDKISP